MFPLSFFFLNMFKVDMEAHINILLNAVLNYNFYVLWVFLARKYDFLINKKIPFVFGLANSLLLLMISVSIVTVAMTQRDMSITTTPICQISEACYHVAMQHMSGLHVVASLGSTVSLIKLPAHSHT